LEDVRSMMGRMKASLESVVDEQKLRDILKFIVLQGRVTRDQLIQQFSLAERNELRPILATLKNEGLIKEGRGFYPDPKLIQAYRITGGFNLS